MELVMNTENVRALAAMFGNRSDEAASLATRILGNLDFAAMDDTHGINATLGLLSEDLHVGDIALGHQADIMDGLTVDVDALSEELGVDAWRVEQQLRKVEQGQLDTGEVIISLIDWGKDDIVGLDTTIRDFVPDAPEIGEDPEFDDLLQRLDGWLLSMVIDQREGSLLGLFSGQEGLAALLEAAAITDAEALADRTADLRALAQRLGVTDATTRPADHILHAVTVRLGDQRKLSRVGNLPSLGELFDVTWEESEYRDWEGNTDDGEYVTKKRRADLTIAEQEALVRNLDQRFGGLEWLPEVLAGQADPPPELATDPTLQALLVDFASHHHYREHWDRRYRTYEPANAEVALQYLRSKNLIATSLEHPRPAQKARLPFADGTLDNAIEFGRRQGAITEGNEADARAVALHLAGLDPTVDLSTIDPADLAAEAAELNIPEFVALLSGTVPPHQLTEQRLVQAVSYLQQAGTVEERVRRAERAILGLMTVSSVGEAATTTHQFRTSLPEKVQAELTDIHVGSRDFDWLLQKTGVPGYHKSPDMRSGSGKRYYHLVNEGDGLTSDFVVERIPKKKGFFAKYGLTIIKVGISFFVPAAAILFAAMDAVQAAANGDWLNAGLAVAGALAGGAAMWASSAGTAVAQTAAKAASFVNNGLKAGVAFARGDGLSGVINSVTALAAGASAFGMNAAGQNLANAAKVARGIDATVDAIKGDDIAGAIAGGLSTGSAVVNLGSSMEFGGLDPDSLTDGQLQQMQDMSRVATTAQQAADVVRAGGAVVDGIENERWGALVGSGLRLGSATSNLITSDQGAVAEHVLDTSSPERFAADSERFRSYEDWADAAADLADGGLALAEGDELGAAALLSGGINGAARAGGIDSVHLERFDAITNLADRLADLPPGADASAILVATGGEVRRLRESFRPSPDQATLRPGDPGQTLAQIESERRSLEAQQRRIDELRSLSGDDALVGGVLADIDARVDHQLATLEREGDLAVVANNEAVEAARQAELARRAEAASRPIEVSELGPLVEVQPGQTLSEIALASGVTVEEILAENPGIADAGTIDAGQTITLPPGAEPPPHPAGRGLLGPDGGPVAEAAVPSLLSPDEQHELLVAELGVKATRVRQQLEEVGRKIQSYYPDGLPPQSLLDEFAQLTNRNGAVKAELANLEKERVADQRLRAWEQEADLDLSFDERIEANELRLADERQHLKDALAASPPFGQEAGALRERLAALDRRKALMDHIVEIGGPTRVEELNALEAGFMVIDTGFSQATEHYFGGDGSDVLLGIKTRKALIDSPEQQQLLADLAAGRKPGTGLHSPDLEFDRRLPVVRIGGKEVGVPSFDTYHVGNIPVDWKTHCEGGVCTTTFTTQPDGIDDIFADHDDAGPAHELPGGTTFRYRPFSWTESYPDPNGVGDPVPTDDGSSR